MTTTTVIDRPTPRQDTIQRLLTRGSHYFASDSRRAFQTALGLIWLLDGALQFQPFMYSKGFIQMLTGTAAGQPHWLASSINWAANIAQSNLAVFNTLRNRGDPDVPSPYLVSTGIDAKPNHPP